MPKSKKPAGGRPAKNFEPRYGEKKTPFHERARGGSAQKPGSKSVTHRGYRAAEEGAPSNAPRTAGPRTGAAKSGAPKTRWTATQRAGRDEARGARVPSHGDRPVRSFDDRPARSGDDRPARRDYNSDRPTRRDYSNDRPARSGDDRPARRDINSDRPARPYGNDRPARSGDERPARRDYSSDRPARPYSNDRPARSNDDRPARRDYSSDRPARSNDDRPARRDYSSDRPARSNDDRPARRDYSSDRPARSNDDRPARRDFNSDRPARSNDDRPARRDYSSDRPARPYSNDRPARPYSNDRPARSFGTERPARANEDRPKREYNADRPRRDDRDRRPAASGNRGDWSAPPRTAAHQQHVDVVHERLQAEAVQATVVDGVTFGSLGLGENIVRTLADLGAATPFAIQAATIPEILAGRDVLARGRTGSGKTIAFGAPLVENVLKSGAGKKREFGRKPKAIILAPTRELALQLDRTIQPIARSVGLFTTQIYGGVPQARQVGALKKGVDIIIGTPGRIEDLITQRKLDLSDVMVAVIDEADHMCELGFLEPVQRILRETADGSQKLLFSATLDREVSSLVDEFLVEPSVHEVAGEDQASSTIEHRVLVIEHRDKAEILDQLVDREGKTLVFARTRAYAEMLAEQFADIGIPAVSLHGDLNQARRTRNLERLTSGRVNVLVATDVAARGIHVDDIDLVIQADAPDEYKTYLHRSGRTGRAGKTGRVVTLITRQRQRKMAEMLERAEIAAPFENVRPGDDTIEELTARVPTAAELTA
ncbi:DEAD/DEAH box helicase [Microbacterium sp. zg.B48]|uniref:DEAD/DEAH box helicase n=1 Tax=Microbacterium sp. zg.B48 TaxID=2969408 RepID=UPI00214BEF26|nr:DEAD/DEAH box helicase [Microbacterium sp. zg.B48]MCR2762635.1 DEAD/DEAH box helicase [Microbacterium sp. zg.B48]